MASMWIQGWPWLPLEPDCECACSMETNSCMAMASLWIYGWPWLPLDPDCECARSVETKSWPWSACGSTAGRGCLWTWIANVRAA